MPSPLPVHTVSSSDGVFRHPSPGLVVVFRTVPGIPSPAETKAFLVSTTANVADAAVIVRARAVGSQVAILLIFDKFVPDTDTVSADVAVWQRGGSVTAEPEGSKGKSRTYDEKDKRKSKRKRK